MPLDNTCQCVVCRANRQQSAAATICDTLGIPFMTPAQQLAFAAAFFSAQAKLSPGELARCIDDVKDLPRPDVELCRALADIAKIGDEHRPPPKSVMAALWGKLTGGTASFEIPADELDARLARFALITRSQAARN